MKAHVLTFCMKCEKHVHSADSCDQPYCRRSETGGYRQWALRVVLWSLIFGAGLCLAFLLSCSNLEDTACDTEPASASNSLSALVNTATFNRYNEWSNTGTKVDRVFTGDSVVAIWGGLPAEQGGYVWFNGSNTATVVNTGIGGNRVCDLVARVSGQITAFQPGFIFVHIGGNDLLGGVSPSRITDRLELLFRTLRRDNPTARIVYGAIPPTQHSYANASKDTVNTAAARELVQIGNACMVEVADLIDSGLPGGASRPDVRGDGIHFDLSVYPKYRERVERGFASSFQNVGYCL